MTNLALNTLIEITYCELSKNEKWMVPYVIPHLNDVDYYCIGCVGLMIKKYGLKETNLDKDYYPPVTKPLICGDCGQLLHHNLSAYGITSELEYLGKIQKWPPDSKRAAILYAALNKGGSQKVIISGNYTPDHHDILIKQVLDRISLLMPTFLPGKPIKSERNPCHSSSAAKSKKASKSATKSKSQ